MGKKKQKYIRNGIFLIDQVLPFVEFQTDIVSKEYVGVDATSCEVKMGSSRYRCFAKFGITCVCCGIEGRYFALERDYKSARFHFNLYAIDADGDEILMTKDHIVPKSKGGKNHLSNYQPMCVTCNRDKGAKFPSMKTLQFIADRERGISLCQTI
jgi:5-methylcytosine-specific restriction endonuclease McrA